MSHPISKYLKISNLNLLHPEVFQASLNPHWPKWLLDFKQLAWEKLTKAQDFYGKALQEKDLQSNYFRTENVRLENTENVFVKQLEDVLDLPIVQNTLTELLTKASSARDLLSLCYASTGYVVLVPQNTSLKEPILLSHILQTDRTEVFTLTLIITENNAQCSVIQTVKAPNASTYHAFNALTHTHLHSGSSLNYIFSQALNPQCIGNATFHHVIEEASLTNTTISVSGQSVNIATHLHLNAKDARAEVYGLAVAHASEELHWQTFQNHNATETTSSCLQKIIATDNASAHFTGSIDMPFQLCSASQRNDNLILSETAKVTSFPAIHIHTDNVTCTHGTTVGHIQSEDLFYAQTRGISKDAAQKLLALGFAQTILEKIPESAQQSLSEPINHVL